MAAVVVRLEEAAVEPADYYSIKRVANNINFTCVFVYKRLSYKFSNSVGIHVSFILALTKELLNAVN